MSERLLSAVVLLYATIGFEFDFIWREQPRCGLVRIAGHYEEAFAARQGQIEILEHADRRLGQLAAPAAHLEPFVVREHAAERPPLERREGIARIMRQEKPHPRLEIGFEPCAMSFDLGYGRCLVDRRGVVNGFAQALPIAQGIAVGLFHRLSILDLMNASNRRANSFVFSRSIGRRKSMNAAPTFTMS